MKKILRYCFDLDGVICKTKGNDYKNAKPLKKAINKINQLYNKGHYILVYTSRFMGRSNENSSLARQRGYKLSYNQLKLWGLKFNKLKFGKPSYDIIIDDKSIFFSDKWVNEKL